MKGKVELSLRLSRVDPEAAKKLRVALGRKRQTLTSEGEEIAQLVR